MTTTVTVKTAGHTAFVEVRNFFPGGTNSEYIMLPGTTRDFIVTETQDVTVEERKVEVIHPENKHASVV